MSKRKGGAKTPGSSLVVIDDEFRRKFADYCLMDDYYMSVFFRDDPASAQCVLKVILEKPDLIVESVKVQEELFSATGRRAVLDVLATDSIGTIYDIEVQRTGDGADPLRARYYSSLIDANALPAGAGYADLREKYVILITETDVFGRGLPAYRFSRMLEGDGMGFGDRDHIVYVNGANRDAGTALGRLMRDFFCRKSDGMHYDELRKRTKEPKGTSKNLRARTCQTPFRSQNRQKASKYDSIPVFFAGFAPRKSAGIFEQQVFRSALKEGGVNMSDVIRELVEKGIEQGREEGMEQGMEKGREAAKADAACRMIGKGLDIEMISECLDLPVDYVRSIAKAAD